MKAGFKYFTLLSAGGMICLLAASLQATTIVDDDFSDGDTAKTGALDTPWFTSSSSSGIEISAGSLGLVTGTSGRGIHTVFPTQSLAIGEMIRATYTFTTPASIDVSGSNNSSFRVGFFDNLGRLTANNLGVDPNDTRSDLCCLDATVNASSSDQNAVYGWGQATGGPGSQPLPGYMLDMDVYATGDAAATGSDLNFREHNQDSLFGTGRLMSTTSRFDNISPSGPDVGYTWAPNTEYTGSFTIARVDATTVGLRATLDGASYINNDQFDSVDFGMFGFHVNSNKFGSSNSAGDADNGLDFSRVTIEVLPIPEPATATMVLGAVALLAGIGRRR
ncbi:MAG: hypothetical protein AAGD11_09385 [Planctomycetota bacterium]